MTTLKPRKFESPPAHIKAHFSSVPWALEIFNDPSLQTVTYPTGEERDPNDTGDTFCQDTLATADTIAAWQTFYKPASQDGPHEVLFLLKLGSGLNGHIDTCHGGFVSLMLDEVMGVVADYEKATGTGSMTASLKVDYKRPVKTPGIVLCRAIVTKREGRKLWATGTVEDGRGTVLAQGEGLFLEVGGLGVDGKKKLEGNL